jgi:diguanylate cyclase (GGDEF)-like protein
MTTQRLHSVLNNNLVIIYLDSNGIINHANNKLFELSHMSESDVINKNILDVLSLDTPPVDFENIKHGEIYKDIITLKDENNNSSYIALDIVAIDTEDKATELLAIGIDITEFEQKQKNKDKNIIVSRSKSMEKKHQEIALLRQELVNLEKEILQKERHIKEQDQTISKITEDNKKTKSVIKKIKSVSIDLPDILLDLEISRCRRYGVPLSLVVCGLDFFADLNQNYSNEDLKKLLDAIKKKLTTTIRETDYISIDGSSIYIILTNTNAEQAKQFAEKVRVFFKASKFHFKDSNVTLSYGIIGFNPVKNKIDFLTKAKEVSTDMMEKTVRATLDVHEF